MTLRIRRLRGGAIQSEGVGRRRQTIRGRALSPAFSLGKSVPYARGV